MKKRFSLMISDQFIRICFLLSFISIIPLIAVIIITYPSLPPLIPFFNSMPWGEERLVFSGVTIFLPFVLLTIFIQNIIQATIAYSKYVLVARIVLFNCSLFLLLGLLSYLQILFLTF